MNKDHISYDFREGQLVMMFHDRPQDSWDIYSVPNDVLIDVLAWNDPNGDFQDLDRVQLLEIFITDFIDSKNEKPSISFDYNKYYPKEEDFSESDISEIIVKHGMVVTDELIQLAKACWAEAKIHNETQLA